MDQPPEADPDEVEIPLAGGMGSNGAVVRVGDTVRRPVRPHSDAVRSFLEHLGRVGFDGAPRWIGYDVQGREILSFLEGDVGIPPFPEWIADDELLVSVAELQRRLHDASASFVVPPGAVWDLANVPAAGPDAIVCHNDLCVENVVVRSGRAVGVIDFDFASPADRRFDIAVAARHWAPIKDPIDLDAARVSVDPIARFRRFADAHGLDGPDREIVVGMLGAFLDRAMISMRRRADDGNELYRQVWESGYPEQNRRSRAYLDAHAAALARTS